MANSKFFHVQLTVFCSICANWEYMDCKKVKNAIREAKIKGWKLKKQGWICPKCQQKTGKAG